MRAADLFSLSFSALTHHPGRSLLSALGIAVGVAAVILLTALGEGLHRFVLAEFTQFGTNMISVSPGKTKTHGGSVGMFGSVRPLSLQDAEALGRVPRVIASDPMVQGNAEVEGQGRSRRVTLYGVGPGFARILSIRVAAGSFLPPDAVDAPRAYAVLGAKVRHELFGAASPLGQRIRVGGQRYRVIGVMAAKGQVLGFDLDDTVYIPAARALDLFNREGLMEIHVAHDPAADSDAVSASLKRVLMARHGSEDFTVTPQKQQLAALDSILDVLTFAVAALGSISLLVGGVGILTLMTITVAERTGEIGLLNALGARRGQIMALFLAEAIFLAALGGGAGLALGLGAAGALHALIPALPVSLAWDYVLAAEAVAVVIGLAAGVDPARRAANMDPVQALRAE
ncbi:MAG: peptide ABC transporter permease [Hydrogenophilales bacterium 28-61-23]|nr:MAG: peptide ABC transporter permease [Hydrogenophilales bacterium 28-61-23]